MRNTSAFAVMILGVGCGHHPAPSIAPVSLVGCSNQKALVASAVEETSVDMHSQFMKGPMPLQPDSLRGKAGRVMVEFVIGTDGRAERCSLRVVASSDAKLVPYAFGTIMQSFYRPAELNKFPVRTAVLQTVNFPK